MRQQLRLNWSGFAIEEILKSIEQMQRKNYEPRLVALDIRSRRSGFAIFEGPRNLLDFGTIASAFHDERDAGKAISNLLLLGPPSVIVVMVERWNRVIQRPDSLAGKLQAYATAQTIQVHQLKGHTVNQIFQDSGCETKTQVAAAVASIFPQLAWRVPPKRKIWQSEHSRQRMFDAVALGIAYWQSESGFDYEITRK